MMKKCFYSKHSLQCMLQKIQYWKFQLDQSDIEGVMVWSQLAVPGEAPRLLQMLIMVLYNVVHSCNIFLCCLDGEI